MTCSCSSTLAARVSGVVAGEDRDPRLRDDRTAVELLGHEVDGRSVDLGARRDRPRVGVQSRKAGAAGKGGC